MKFLAALLAALNLLLLPSMAGAQNNGGARTVVTERWVEEWDPVAERWVKIADQTVEGLKSL